MMMVVVMVMVLANKYCSALNGETRVTESFCKNGWCPFNSQNALLDIRGWDPIPYNTIKYENDLKKNFYG